MAPYALPKLLYDFSEFTPVISEEIMKVHYEKHHAGYVKNTNDGIKKLEDAMSKDDLSQQIVIQNNVKFNGGGHINHCLFWENLAPISKGGGVVPEGTLKAALISTFGSVEKCIEVISSLATGVQGSGWGWLGYCPVGHHLHPATTENHDLLITKGLIPLLCLDVWEHAYYLQYKNARADYVKAIWSIVDWRVVEKRFNAAKA
jgi:Fe-Mn family superoxide dismutase